MKIRTDFPGGNVVVRNIDGKRIELSPDLRDTSTNWFYWYFEAEFDAPGEYEFVFDMPAVGSQGPAVSLDGGATWNWGGGLLNDVEGFRYVHDGKVNRVHFCMGIPYLQKNWEQLGLPVTELCKSREGRSVELFTHGSGSKHTYFFSARRHCCEMAANYVLEGVIKAALADPAQDFKLLVVPFVDKDGVENGDQGKNRKPHDHNRDYNEVPLYPETKAVMELVEREKPEVILDIHCPWLRGGDTNETIYIVGVEPHDAMKRVDRFSGILEQESKHSVPYYASDNVLFGMFWNTRDNYDAGKSFSRWGNERPWSPLCASVEIPYATTHDMVLTPELWRKFGITLWRAVRKYSN